MTDDEILERLRAYFQTKVENLSGDEMAEGPFEDGTEDGELWEQAASRIDARGGLRVRFEFGDTDPALTAAAQQREERAVAEARPHDRCAHETEYERLCKACRTAGDDGGEETDAEREARFDAAALDVVSRCVAEGEDGDRG